MDKQRWQGCLSMLGTLAALLGFVAAYLVSPLATLHTDLRQVQWRQTEDGKRVERWQVGIVDQIVQVEARNREQDRLMGVVNERLATIQTDLTWLRQHLRRK